MAKYKIIIENWSDCSVQQKQVQKRALAKLLVGLMLNKNETEKSKEELKNGEPNKNQEGAK